MWRILLVVSVTHAAHTAHNTSDVIIMYSGHADAQPQSFPRDNSNIRKETERTADRSGERKGDKLKQEGGHHERSDRVSDVIKADSDYLENTPVVTNKPDDEIVFIPSGNRESQGSNRGEERRGGGRSGERRGENYRRVMAPKHRHNDIDNERAFRQPQTEAPKDGVVFKPGKNNEQEEEKLRHETDDIIIERTRKQYKDDIQKQNPIDCVNLDCDNVVDSVCGVKIQNKKPKHRLFMNECYFRKVNCGLRYEYNRYLPVPLGECDHVGAHAPPRQEHRGWIVYQEPTTAKSMQPNFPSFRRAMTANDNGLPCEHSCPNRCPDTYAPVCAYAFPKQARVFQNHCLLDQHSCMDGSVWQQRPLAECSGMARAEVHERAAFIGWMQRIGILDKKGHFVMT